jgi:hypothetical protein
VDRTGARTLTPKGPTDPEGAGDAAPAVRAPARLLEGDPHRGCRHRTGIRDQ